jgi:hypothetical protein
MRLLFRDGAAEAAAAGSGRTRPVRQARVISAIVPVRRRDQASDDEHKKHAAYGNQKEEKYGSIKIIPG